MQKQELQQVIGRNLQHIRAQKRMTQEQLAEKAGLSTTFYANLECGNRMMSVVTLRKLADVLGVSTDSLLYTDREGDTCQRIRTALRGQPLHTAAMVEKLVLFYISELTQGQPSGEQQQMKGLMQDELAV